LEIVPSSFLTVATIWSCDKYVPVFGRIVEVVVSNLDWAMSRSSSGNLLVEPMQENYVRSEK
jgi:hypothetical protein